MLLFQGRKKVPAAHVKPNFNVTSCSKKRPPQRNFFAIFDINSQNIMYKEVGAPYLCCQPQMDNLD